jgi:hypothetical protein
MTLLPLVVAGALVFGLGYFFWETSIDALRAFFEQWQAVKAAKEWLRGVGGGALVSVLEPLLLVMMAVPVLVVFSLLLVAVLMTPAVVNLVAARRFAGLQRLRGAPWWQAAGWSLLCTAGALLLLLASLPMWFVPPFVLLLPPLIWGWLTYKVMAFDVLAEHASVEERRQIMAEQRWPLLTMGVVCGYLGAAPSLVWAAGALSLVFAPLMLVVSVWLYTLVFAFSALWFAHFALAQLQLLRSSFAKPMPDPNVLPKAPMPVLPAP